MRYNYLTAVCPLPFEGEVMGGAYLTGFVEELLYMGDMLRDMIWQVFHESGVFGSGTNTFSAVVLTLLGGFFSWHILQLVVAWFRSHALSEHDWEHVHRAVLAMFLAGAMTAAKPLEKFDGATAKDSVFAGLSYSKATGALSDTAAFAMVEAIKDVDICKLWNDGLVFAQAAKEDRILAAMGQERVGIASAMDDAKTAANVPPGSSGVLGRIGAAYEKVKAAAGDISSFMGAMWTLGTNPGKAILGAGYGVLKGMIMRTVHVVVQYGFNLAYIAFSIFAIRTTVLLIIYLRIGITLALCLLPGMIGLAFWNSTRGFAINAVRNLVLLLMMSSALGTLVKTAFSKEVLRTVQAIALMEAPVGSAANKVTDMDKIMVSLNQVFSHGEKTGPDDILFWSNVDFGDYARSLRAPIANMFVLSLMMGMISKLFEALGQTLNGRYDAMAQHGGGG